MEYHRSVRGTALHGLKTSLLYTSHRLDSLDHGAEFLPAAPEGEPAGQSIVLAVEVTAEAGQGKRELFDAEVGAVFFVSPAAEDFHVQRRPHIRGRAEVRLPFPRC